MTLRLNAAPVENSVISQSPLGLGELCKGNPLIAAQSTKVRYHWLRCNAQVFCRTTALGRPEDSALVLKRRCCACLKVCLEPRPDVSNAIQPTFLEYMCEFVVERSGDSSKPAFSSTRALAGFSMLTPPSSLTGPSFSAADTKPWTSSVATP